MKPRIVFAAPRPPWPLDGGWNQRMFHLLAGLARVGDVDLVCYASPDGDRGSPDLGLVGELCRDVHVLPHPPDPWPGRARTYRDVVQRYVLTPRPYLVQAFPGRPLAERIEGLAEKADLVWVDRVWVAEWLPALPCPTIVDLDDLESVKEQRRLALAPPSPWQIPLRLDNRRLRSLERRSAARYAAVAVCSERDRRFFPARLRDRVLVVPNGVPAALLSAPRAPEEPRSLVMVGRMRYEPNLAAALWFIDEILPLIAADVPDVRLHVVGDHRSEALARAHDGRRVVVTGRVDDVAPVVTRSAVSVAPIRVAGGTRIKILEALALGTPVVSTTIGAEGLDVAHGRHLRIADTAAAFAREVVALLRDSEARESLRRAGRSLVEERYTWEAIQEMLAVALERHLGPAGRDGSE